MALGIDGLRIGTWTHGRVPTGCTVVLPPPGTLGAVAVRGQAPGTREAAALGPTGKVLRCDAVVLAGGSAFGLAAADGVVAWLEEQGVGYPLPGGQVVPIVGAAIVLDLGVAAPDARPDAAAGRAACDTAGDGPVPEGAVGAGAGCTIAKVAGLEWAWRGGQGTAVRQVDDLTVAALVVTNAVGELVAADGTSLAASRAPLDVPRWPRQTEQRSMPEDNTVIGVVATNARLDKAAAHRVADLAHDGVVHAIDPAHTSLDGDALFCLATGEVEATVDRVAALAVDAVAEATRRGPLAAPDVEIAGPSERGPLRIPGRAQA